ncbi:AAA family ATPase [Acinetobacter tandoii]
MSNTVNNGIANIRNISQCYDVVMRTLQRNTNLPGLAGFYGPSGFGKSFAANYVANKTGAYYVQVKSTYTKKSFLQAVLREMSIPEPKTLNEMMEYAACELAKSGKPLIVDEFDYLVDSRRVEVVRDLYEASQGTILVIGEELLPRKLERWERFHGRILNWAAALPIDLEDSRLLQHLYAPSISVEDVVLERLIVAVKGSTRRVSTNLEMLNEQALENGVQEVTLKNLSTVLPHGWITGESPKPRTF